MVQDEDDLDDAAHAERLQAVEREIQDDPGWQAYQRWQELARTLDVHRRNIRALATLINAPHMDPELAMELIQNERPAHARVEFFAALDQFLHNALASAVTLIEHTRRTIGHYEGTEFAAEFNRRNDAIKDDSRAVFIRRLRNYLVHYGELPVQHSVSFSGVEPLVGYVSRVQLVSSTLLVWDDWTAPARRFLEENPIVDLGQLIDWYRAAMDGLYAWVTQQFDSLHGEEIRVANAIIANYNRILTGED